MKIKLLSENAKAPTYATDGAACFDFYAAEPVTVRGWSSAVVDTGIAVEVPENFALLLFSRSGHGFKHGIRLANVVGVVDSDFRGSVKVCLHNDSGFVYSVAVGERIAQGMLVATFRHRLEVVDELSETKRCDGGMGSTGK
jgi:dUTP pyrophosphatase